MDFSIHSLGSGSCGNSMLIQAGGTRILLDAGISVLQLKKRLALHRVTLEDLDAVVLTHEHGDHTRSVCALSRRFRIPVIANPATICALSHEYALSECDPLDTGQCMTIGSIVVESFPVSHDAVDPVGYNIYHKEWKASFVMDTGVAGEDVARSIEGANLAVIEANHDIERLMNGPYPWFLKNRILSDRGHLSNAAAAELVLRHASRSNAPVVVWLAHLSETNNRPRLARRYVERRLAQEGCTNVRLEVALREVATLTWRPGDCYGSDGGHSQPQPPLSGLATS